MSDDGTSAEVVQPRLRLDFGRAHGFLSPEGAAALRDELRILGDPAAGRLAGQLDTTLTVLLASPLHAGTRGLRIASDEHAVVLEALEQLEADPSDEFAEARRELA